jgi:hypothetical protein
VAFSPDGVWLAAAGQGQLILYRWGYPKLKIESGRFKGAVGEGSVSLRTPLSSARP